MVGKERKVVAGLTSTVMVVGSVISATITVTESMENLHNMWSSFSMEPEDAGANAMGYWALWAIRTAAAKRASPGVGLASITDSENQDILVAFGVWAASNETPYNSGSVFYGNISRNIPKGGRLELRVGVEGLTAGQVTGRNLLGCNTRTV